MRATLTTQDKQSDRILRAHRRMHGGRWPRLRAYASKRMSDRIVEIVRWIRPPQPRGFCVAEWRMDELSVRFFYFATYADAELFMSVRVAASVDAQESG